MIRVCRICLQELLDPYQFYSLSETDGTLDKLKLSVPQLNKDTFQGAIICANCAEELHVTHSFIQKCIKSEEKVQRFMAARGKTFSEVDLKEVSEFYQDPIKSEQGGDWKGEIEVCEVKMQDVASVDNDGFDESPYVFVEVFDTDEVQEEVKEPAQSEQNAESAQKRYECHLCKKMYVTKDYLRYHMRTHTGERLFSCNICSKSFTFRSGLRDHIKTHTGYQRYKCDVCETAFKRLYQLKLHTAKHGDSLPHECKYCKKQFASVVEVEEHLKGHCTAILHKCKVCGLEFNMKTHYDSHCKAHTGQKLYECQNCKCTFSHKNVLMSHYRLKSCNKTTETIPKADGDAQETQNGKIVLESVPIRSRSGKITHGCSVCGSRFSSIKRLEGHMRHHTGEKYQCSECKKEFTERGTLTRHLRIHTGEKPYVCTICGNRFTYASVLNKHLYIHTGEKPFLCTGCGTAFRRRHHLKAHFLSFHSGVND